MELAFTINMRDGYGGLFKPQMHKAANSGITIDAFTNYMNVRLAGLQRFRHNVAALNCEACSIIVVFASHKAMPCAASNPGNLPPMKTASRARNVHTFNCLTSSKFRKRQTSLSALVGLQKYGPRPHLQYNFVILQLASVTARGCMILSILLKLCSWHRIKLHTTSTGKRRICARISVARSGLHTLQIFNEVTVPAFQPASCVTA